MRWSESAQQIDCTIFLATGQHVFVNHHALLQNPQMLNLCISGWCFVDA
jgi:hypothetical protein